MSNYQGIENLEMDGEDKLTELERSMVTLKTEQHITGKKTFDSVVIYDLSLNEKTTFSTVDGIIQQLKGNTSGDLFDYGNYATYQDGTVKYKGIINKAGTDKFYVFHNQINEPDTTLNLNTQNLGSLCVREPVDDNEVATKGYVTSHGGGNYLPLSGGTMNGDIDMGGKNMKNLEVIRFNEPGVFNYLLFRDTKKMIMGSYNSSTPGTIDPFVHLNDSGSNKLIELMKDIDLHGNINVKDNKRITGLQTPVDNSEPATKAYVDGHSGGNYLPLSGGTLTGDLNMDNNRVTNLNGGVAPADAVNRAQLDNLGTQVQANTDAITGFSHLPKYHTHYAQPFPDTPGGEFKTFTNDGFGQIMFEMSSPNMTLDKDDVVKYDIDMPPLAFHDEIVNFELKLYENNVLQYNINSQGTYQGFVGSGYFTRPSVLSGSHVIRSTGGFVVFKIQVTCRPVVLHSTARFFIGTNGVMTNDAIYRCFNVEKIGITP